MHEVTLKYSLVRLLEAQTAWEPKHDVLFHSQCLYM